MKVTKSSTGLVVRVGPGIHAYVLGLAALSPLVAILSDGGIAREQLPAALLVTPISLVLMAFLVEVAEFKFSPLTHSLHWWARTAFSRREGSVALGDIDEVRVTSRMNLSDGYVLHNVVIAARGMTIPLRRSISTGTAGHQAVAYAIVEYLTELGYSPQYVAEDPGTRGSKPSNRTLILPRR